MMQTFNYTEKKSKCILQKKTHSIHFFAKRNAKQRTDESCIFPPGGRGRHFENSFGEPAQVSSSSHCSLLQCRCFFQIVHILKFDGVLYSTQQTGKDVRERTFLPFGIVQNMSTKLLINFDTKKTICESQNSHTR